MSHARPEIHFADRIGWLRAAVLGANDGLVSTASLIVGVAASHAARSQIVVAGAMAMACGEYVSVSSQADSERADQERERRELETEPDSELAELTGIYRGRGLDATLAHEVAVQLTTHDALGAHLRDELGLSETHAARPLQAALTSAATFAVGAALPLLAAVLAPERFMIPAVAASTLVFLAGMGTLAARVGGSAPLIGAVRVTFWGALAMGATAVIGYLFGAVV